MDTNSPVYNELNKAWKVTCKVLFGEEIGELKEYEDWLKEYLPKRKGRVSHSSGKEVVFALDLYSDHARFISADELKEKSMPLNINQIKDIDSIMDAISERWEYCGNRIFGNSKFIESSDFVTDSQYVAESSDVTRSSHIFASTQIWDSSRYLFGCSSVYGNEFAIRNLRSDRAKRVFEIHFCLESSDAYCSSNCFGCNDILFCFNQRYRRNCIGNLQLPQDKYLSLKKKLISEIREELKKNKRFPSIFRLVPDEKPTFTIKVNGRKELEDYHLIEKAFASTFKVLFKREGATFSEYSEWLSKYVPLANEIKSPFGIDTYQPPKNDIPAYALLPKNRIVSEQELVELSKLQMDEKDIGSLESVKNNLGKIGFFTGELREGTVVNVIKSPVAYNVSNLYNMSRAADATYVAFSSTVVKSSHIFGSYRINSSQFCINCYNSVDLNRCFEMDTSVNCSDTYFAHNCEGLQDAMFCFNVKGKRHAIGNTELPPDQYRKIKDMLVEQMANEIIKTKQLRYDIYNIGCGKK